MTVRVRVVAGPEFARVAARLGIEDASAEGEFTRAIRQAAAPIVAHVQRRAMALPAHGPKHTGLRGRLAAGVRVQPYQNGIRIVATALDPTEAALPRGMDNGPQGWRHPVYGNRDVWVRQRGGSWFREPISTHREEVSSDLEAVVEDMAENIASAGGTAVST